jgi:diguanylate cyclase (GGDEF)-like protein
MINKNILKEIKLLYVEDDDSIRSVLSTRLERSVKRLFVAQDGEDGYTQFLEHKPDIVITDLKMPKMDGIALIQKIREKDKKIPIIITSAHGDSNYLLDAIGFGVYGYLIKPVNKNSLYELLYAHAKTVLFERECEAQNRILQNIINNDANLIAITKGEIITYANKTFLDFYSVSSVEEFIYRYKGLFNTFVRSKDYLHQGVLKDDETFIEHILKSTDIQRVASVMDGSSFEPKIFYIKLSILDALQDTYLWNFTDVTEMTMEKIDIKHKIYFDKLTGVHNRAKMEEVLTYELQQQKRYNTPFSFIIIDIDHFKNFNDTYGHIIGDEVLISVAKISNQTIRKSDTFARWGGEEFALLLSNTELENAKIVAENIRESIENLNHRVAGKITASFGITGAKQDDTIESIFKRADEALYEAKAKGRNRVEVLL